MKREPDQRTERTLKMQQLLIRPTSVHCQELDIPGPQGILLHTRIWGDLGHATTTILAIHGIYQASQCWEHQASLAKEKTVLIAFDLPFHGATITPDHVSFQADLFSESIHAIIEFFGLHETHLFLMGWSFGAWCLGYYLQQYGTSAITGVIIISGIFGDITQCLSLIQEQHRDALNAMSIVTNPTATHSSILLATQQFVHVLRHTFPLWKNDSEEYAMVLGYNVRAVFRLLFSQSNPLDIVAEHRLKGLYDQLNQALIPICMLTGIQDALLPLEWFRLVADQLTHVEIHEQDQCGHSFFAEYPETFNTIVHAFLNTCHPYTLVSDMAKSSPKN